jgi:hypothetical protein
LPDRFSLLLKKKGPFDDRIRAEVDAMRAKYAVLRCGVLVCADRVSLLIG